MRATVAPRALGTVGQLIGDLDRCLPELLLLIRGSCHSRGEALHAVYDQDAAALHHLALAVVSIAPAVLALAQGDGGHGVDRLRKGSALKADAAPPCPTGRP